MKYGIASIILAITGICLIVWINYEFSQNYMEFASKFEAEGGVTPSVVMTNWINRSIAIGISLFGLALGIKSYRIEKKIGIIGIILSILLLILVFFPIWPYLISE
ncbi:hypothetical protein [Seonamhaeicola maritimus]|uniref:DUF998 domain-containing protein n=1 Tax=Seonamhaeicola maritimus TaxID=2591822 RepID=A0A5C7GH25_9FLAO|nr:hypothetical protein [Seonamhaeicola maritimus]TXG36689.1 hypothetical protein FUA22_08900 [Seonamhaeicola maritimus]